MLTSKLPTYFSSLPFPQSEMQSSTVVLEIPEVYSGNSTSARMHFLFQDGKFAVELKRLESEDLDEHNQSKSDWVSLGFLTDAGISLMTRHSHRGCSDKFELIAGASYVKNLRSIRK